MPTIIYISHDDKQFEADVPVGNTVMQGAIDNLLDGILAECGGACACATCHCYVDEAWLEKAGEAGELEKSMLDAVVDPKNNSRLSCQITVTDELDGLIVRTPRSQY